MIAMNTRFHLGGPIDCEQKQLPFVELLEGFSSYVYMYRPYQSFGFRVAIWGKDEDSRCQRFIHDTGAILLEFPDSYHEEIESIIASTGRSMAEVIAELAERRWPETVAAVESQMRRCGPLRSEHVPIPSQDMDTLIQHAEIARLFDSERDEPELDCVDGVSDRVIVKTDDGRESDLVCAEWSGFFESDMGRFILLACELAGFSFYPT